MTRLLFIFSILSLLLTGCLSTNHNTELEGYSPTPMKKISDAVNGDGNANFYFLPPLVADPAPAGVFDPTLAPVAEVYECQNPPSNLVDGEYDCDPVATALVTLPMDLQPEEEFYMVNWDTKSSSLNVDKNYRLLIVAADIALGYADLDLCATGKEMKNVKNGAIIPLKDDRTLPIKVRIEEGALVPPCEEGVIAHWDFEDGAGNVLTDRSCNEQHGQIMGGPAWVDGIQGGGLLFDGDNDYIDMGNNPVLDITGDLTISIWLKPDYSGETDYFEVISKRNASNHTGVYGINIHPTAAWIQFFYSTSPGQWTYPPYRNIPTGGEWTHFVGTRKVDVNTNSVVLKYYYNGSLVHTDDESRSLPSAHIEEPLIVGMLPNYGLFYKGIMDNIRIFDRVLDNAEIQTLYQE